MRATSNESEDFGPVKWRTVLRANMSFAKKFCITLSAPQRLSLKIISRDLGLSLSGGELRLIDGNWYVTHAGLMRLSAKNRCYGIDVRPVLSFCDPPSSRWAFKATVFKSRSAEDSSATVMPIRPMSLRSSAVPRCAWPRPGRSIAPCAKPTASASARSRKSGHSPNQFPLSGFEEASAPTGQRKERKLRRPQGPRPSLPDHPPAQARSRTGEGLRRRLLRHEDAPRGHPRTGRELRRATGRLGRERPQCPALPAQQLPRSKQEGAHETPESLVRRNCPRFTRFRTASSSSGSMAPSIRWHAHKPFLRPPLSILEPSIWPDAVHYRPSVLHAESDVEAGLVPARFPLRPGASGPRTSRREGPARTARRGQDQPHRTTASPCSTSTASRRPASGKISRSSPIE